MTVPCPHCGALIPEDATFCQHCGSSDADGWRDEWSEGDGDWEDEFDYESFVEENFSESPVNKRTRPIWRLTAAAVLLCFILAYLLL